MRFFGLAVTWASAKAQNSPLPVPDGRGRQQIPIRRHALGEPLPRKPAPEAPGGGSRRVAVGGGRSPFPGGVEVATEAKRKEDRGAASPRNFLSNWIEIVRRRSRSAISIHEDRREAV